MFELARSRKFILFTLGEYYREANKRLKEKPLEVIISKVVFVDLVAVYVMEGCTWTAHDLLLNFFSLLSCCLKQVESQPLSGRLLGVVQGNDSWHTVVVGWMCPGDP